MDARTNCCCTVDGCVHTVTSAHVDLQIDNNATWMDAFQFGEPDDTTWTLDGQTFKMDVQHTYYDALPLLTLATADGRIVVDDTVQRVIHFNVNPADIQAALNPGAYVYDLIMINGSTPGVRVPLMHGEVFLSQGVTDISDLGDLLAREAELADELEEVRNRIAELEAQTAGS